MNRPVIHAFKWFAVVCFFLSVVFFTFAIERYVTAIFSTANPLMSKLVQLKEDSIIISISSIPSAMFGILYILCLHTLRTDELLKK